MSELSIVLRYLTLLCRDCLPSPSLLGKKAVSYLDMPWWLFSYFHQGDVWASRFFLEFYRSQVPNCNSFVDGPFSFNWR